jgi:hypothetical protein
VDGFVTEADGSVPSFRDPQALHNYALARQIQIREAEPVLSNLDVIEHWLRHASSTAIDCHAFLDAWNLFTDLSQSVHGNFDHQHKRTQRVYEKLFWGNNLPSVTPPGKHYTPHWSDQEVVLIGEVLPWSATLSYTRDIV